MAKPDFEVVWQRIVTHEGQPFKTKSDLAFTYRVDGDKVIITDRQNSELTHCARSIWLNAGLLGKIWMLSQASFLPRRPDHDTNIRGFMHLCLCHRR